jgi:hypothetical protein|mmetsp:Transcript_29279/g.53575  ORF Transcript_29279/g.53575 Transcript_29279/m.53575 type:complete len:124 (-) Transcript_29279:1096-1467(-)
MALDTIPVSAFLFIYASYKVSNMQKSVYFLAEIFSLFVHCHICEPINHDVGDNFFDFLQSILRVSVFIEHLHYDVMSISCEHDKQKKMGHRFVISEASPRRQKWRISAGYQCSQHGQLLMIIS